jgi:TIR domain
MPSKATQSSGNRGRVPSTESYAAKGRLEGPSAPAPPDEGARKLRRDPSRAPASGTVAARKYGYHVFLSHNGAQTEWTRQLASRLRAAGLSVFFDEDSISLGEDLLSAIEFGLRTSRHVLLILSPEALASNWVALEYSVSLCNDPAARNRCLIPILRSECDIPLLLRRLKYLDARDDDIEKHTAHLLNAIERVEIEP